MAETCLHLHPVGQIEQKFAKNLSCSCLFMHVLILQNPDIGAWHFTLLSKLNVLHIFDMLKKE